MGTNALSVATPGQDIPSSHHNELVQAFLQDIVPRNASRVAEDLAGQLGTSALRWLRAYVQTYHIGTASNNLIIYEGAPGEIWLQRNDVSKELVKIKDGVIDLEVAGVKRFSVTSSGIDWTTQASASIPKEKVNGFIFVSRTTVNLGTSAGVNQWVAPYECLVWVLPGDFDQFGSDKVFVEYLTQPLTPFQFDLLSAPRTDDSGDTDTGTVGSAYLTAGDRVTRVNTSGGVVLHVFRLS